MLLGITLIGIITCFPIREFGGLVDHYEVIMCTVHYFLAVTLVTPTVFSVVNLLSISQQGLLSHTLIICFDCFLFVLHFTSCAPFLGWF